MTRTETLHPELSADLVEQVRNLPTAGLESLERLLDEARVADAQHEVDVRAEIIGRIEAYDRGEERFDPTPDSSRRSKTHRIPKRNTAKPCFSAPTIVSCINFATRKS